MGTQINTYISLIYPTLILCDFQEMTKDFGIETE